MFDLLEVLPDPVDCHDPRFDAYLDEVTAVWSEAFERGVFPDEGHTESFPFEPAIMDSIAVLETSTWSGSDHIVALTQRMRVHSHLQALMYEDMAATADNCGYDNDPALGWEAASAEIRVALRLTRRAADHELDMALALRDRLPAVLAALKAGEIDQRRAMVYVEATSHLPVAVASMVVDRTIEHAPRLTTGQLRERIRRMSFNLDPEDAARRYEQAVDERNVILEPTEAGTANLHILDAPPEAATAAFRHIDTVARSLRRQGETRSLGQLRSDVTFDLLLGRSRRSAGRRGGGTVNLSVDLATLAHLDNHTGTIDGYGPVIADIARRVAAVQRDATWTFCVTDPSTRRTVVTGVTRRRPTAAQHRTVTAMHPTCIFPGCRAPARDCDVDHRRPWSEGGETAVENLAPLCRHDHRLKHEHGWQLTRVDNGDHVWTSPLGHTYTTTGRSP